MLHAADSLAAMSARMFQHRQCLVVIQPEIYVVRLTFDGTYIGMAYVDMACIVMAYLCRPARIR